MRIVLWFSVLALIAGIVWAYQEVPPRKNMLRIVVALMAEECQWEHGRLDMISGLKCVKEKIDMQLEQLADGDVR